MTSPPTLEEAEVVIVGARLAGCAAAITYARAGARVIAIDRAHFPSNTPSTHGDVLQPCGRGGGHRRSTQGPGTQPAANHQHHDRARGDDGLRTHVRL